MRRCQVQAGTQDMGNPFTLNIMLTLFSSITETFLVRLIKEARGTSEFSTTKMHSHREEAIYQNSEHPSTLYLLCSWGVLMLSTFIITSIIIIIIRSYNYSPKFQLIQTFIKPTLLAHRLNLFLPAYLERFLEWTSDNMIWKITCKNSEKQLLTVALYKACKLSNCSIIFSTKFECWKKETITEFSQPSDFCIYWY